MIRRLQAFLRARSWLVFAAGFACFPFGSALAEDIKIGVLEPFTGPWAKNGNESYVAMEIARDMINEKGGIRGNKIAFIRGDAPDPSAGKSEAERIITRLATRNRDQRRGGAARGSPLGDDRVRRRHYQAGL